jgi:hypothetical protein
MKTFGNPSTHTLVSVILDDDGNPRLDTLAPHPRPENWEPPILVPLIKQTQPEFNSSLQYCTPKLVWFGDKVERQWDVLDLPQNT